MEKDKRYFVSFAIFKYDGINYKLKQKWFSNKKEAEEGFNKGDNKLKAKYWKKYDYYKTF